MQTVSDKHTIFASGTFEIDPVKMEVRDAPDRLNAIHYNITGFLSGHFKYFIENWSPPIMTLRLQITNTTAYQVYDVRIIYTDLYGKSVENPYGYTNYLDPPGGAEFNPFHYFAKEYPNHAFPVGPGGIDDEIMVLNWPAGQPAFVTYVIECSLGGNAQEPISIHDFNTDGDITSAGGGMIVSCAIDDWQDNVTAVSILSNGISSEPATMYRYRDTDYWAGSLVRLDFITPGEYEIWIKAESENSGGISLYMPFNVEVPIILNDTPVFVVHPARLFSSISYGYYTSLVGYAEDPEMDDIAFQWEQISPENPQGVFSGTWGANGPTSTWWAPLVDIDTEYLFKITVSEVYGDRESKAIVPVMNTKPVPPIITIPPYITPSPIQEQETGQFIVRATDPSFPYPFIDPPIELKYYWEQLSPVDPEGIWIGSPREKSPLWMAPEVDADTSFIFKLTVTKDWLEPALSVESTVEFTVSNTP